MMTLKDIYNEFNAGSDGFAEAVQSHCGFEISRDEIKRLGRNCATAANFQTAWENDGWWEDPTQTVIDATEERRLYEGKRG
jgi:hypothetical protein